MKKATIINKINPITDGIIDAIQITDNDDPDFDIPFVVQGDCWIITFEQV